MTDCINCDLSNNQIIENNINKNQSKLSQIFKSEIPIDMMVKLFNKISVKYDNYYILNNSSYKKGIFNGDIQIFIENCKQYYYISKRKYLTCQLNYNHFVTVIRQICKHLNIKYTSKIKYEKSTYDIIYNVYLHSPYE
jgi:hypothetical protein